MCAASAASRAGRRHTAAIAAAWFALSLISSGCSSFGALRSHELIGKQRPPIAPEAVHVYLETPAHPYEQIAVVRSSSRYSWAFGSQAKADVVVRRLKEEAAALGANGVLLREIADHEGTPIGTELGGNYMGPRGTADVGIGLSAVTLQRYGWGIAIYLPP